MADTASQPAPARRKFTGAEVLALIERGVIAGEGIELLEGDIWTMPSEGAQHGRLAVWLNRELVRRVSDEVAVACERTIRFADDHWPEPDFTLFPSRLMVDEVRGPEILLLIEIADSSLAVDLKIKGDKYREYGVREYWVVDLEARATHIHRLEGAWPETPPTAFEAELAPALLPGLSLRLSQSGV